jgi:predicted flavoprotein YhiN
MMCRAATCGPARPAACVLLIDHYGNGGREDPHLGGWTLQLHQLHATHRDFLSTNPDFCRSALSRYTPRDFIALVEKHGIAWHEKTLGQLFCDESSKQIIEMLRAECARGRR